MKGRDPQLDKIVAGQPTRRRVTAAKRVIALYDCDISYNDHHFGKPHRAVSKDRARNDTMVIHLDHGEEFWDHGRIGHGQSLRQELIHIPLWIYYPPLFLAEKSSKKVRNWSIFSRRSPMRSEMPIPKDVQGESLIPIAQRVSGGYPRPAIASQYELAYVMRL